MLLTHFWMLNLFLGFISKGKQEKLSKIIFSCIYSLRGLEQRRSSIEFKTRQRTLHDIVRIVDQGYLKNLKRLEACLT